MDLSSANPHSPEALALRIRTQQVWFIPALCQVTKAGIIDLLAKLNAPTSAEVIAKETNCNADIVYRTLRALSSEGYFVENKEKEFELSEGGRQLVSGHPSHTRECLIGVYHDYMVRPWLQFDHTLRTGEIAFDKEFGHPFFEAFERNVTFASIFADAMKSFTVFTSNVSFGSIIGDAKKIVDVGGATGVFLSSILKGSGEQANNLQDCVVYELPKVVEAVVQSGMRDVPEEFRPKFKFDAGNFFEGPITPGGDIYVLKSILHDWADDKAIQILKQVHAAIQKRPEAPARLWLVEGILSDEPNVIDPGRGLDLHMAVLVGGRERTLPQWRELLDKAGFKLDRTTIEVDIRYRVIEATPILH